MINFKWLYSLRHLNSHNPVFDKLQFDCVPIDLLYVNLFKPKSNPNPNQIKTKSNSNQIKDKLSLISNSNLNEEGIELFSNTSYLSSINRELR